MMNTVKNKLDAHTIFPLLSLYQTEQRVALSATRCSVLFGFIEKQ